MPIEKITSKIPSNTKITTIASSNYQVGSKRDEMLDRLILENLDKFQNNDFVCGKFVPGDETFTMSSKKVGFFQKLKEKLSKILIKTKG